MTDLIRNVFDLSLAANIGLHPKGYFIMVNSMIIKIDFISPSGPILQDGRPVCRVCGYFLNGGKVSVYANIHQPVFKEITNERLTD